MKSLFSLFVLIYFLLPQTGLAADYQDILTGKNPEGAPCSIRIEKNINYEIVLDSDGKLLSKTAVGTYLTHLSYIDDHNKYHDPDAYDPNVVTQMRWENFKVKENELDKELLDDGLKLSESRNGELVFSIQIQGVTDLENVKEEATGVLVEVPFRKDLDKTSYSCIFE